MRATVLAGLFACAAMAATTSTASAESTSALSDNRSVGIPTTLAYLSSTNTNLDPPVEAKPAPVVPEPVVHVVQPDESLTTIATLYKTDWYRLFNKNTQISQPDLISVGDKITIPAADEQLTERPKPEPPVEIAAVATETVGQTTPTAAPTTSYSVVRGSTAGNTYTAGYCTWYVKNMRPDLPNNLGNADTWVARARAQGLPTGSTPQVGAVGQQGMHVVYVESVNGDGTVTISEMNYKGLYVQSTRTVAASNFQYIY